MRRLNKRQKEYLLKLANEELRITLNAKHIRELERLNDYETLSQDAHRFLNDLLFARHLRTDLSKFIKEWR